MRLKIISALSIALSGAVACGSDLAVSTEDGSTLAEDASIVDGPAIDASLRIDGGETCEEYIVELERGLLDIVVVLDRSGSMKGPKWDGAVSGLTSFFEAPSSAMLRGALSFFPPQTSNECEPSSYNPPLVALGELSTHAPTLVSALEGTVPKGLTPTYGSLLGSLQFATANQDSNAEHTVVAVLITDGEPTTCDTNISNIANICRSAYNYNGVLTYIVALNGAPLAALSQIALGGGTTQAIDLTADIGLLGEAMKEIQGEALGCEFAIPSPGQNDFDPDTFSLQYTASGTTVALPQTDNENACGGAAGWHYENNSGTMQIVLCPTTCEEFKADVEATVNLVLGCPTTTD